MHKIRIYLSIGVINVIITLFYDSIFHWGFVKDKDQEWLISYWKVTYGGNPTVGSNKFQHNTQ